MYAGTPEIKDLQRVLVHDADFQNNAEDILAVNMQGPQWLDAFFRSTAKRALEARKEREKCAYSQNTNYGMF